MSAYDTPANTQTTKSQAFNATEYLIHNFDDEIDIIVEQNLSSLMDAFLFSGYENFKNFIMKFPMTILNVVLLMYVLLATGACKKFS